jgi:hypothetical protein
MADAGLRAQIEQLALEMHATALGARDERLEWWSLELSKLLAAAPSPDPVAPRAPGGISEVEYAAAVANPPPRRAPEPASVAPRAPGAINTPEGLCTKCSATHYCAEHALDNLPDAVMCDGNGECFALADEVQRLKVALASQAAPAQAPDAIIEEAERLLKDITPGEWKPYSDKLRPDFPVRIHEVQADDVAVVKWGGFDGVDYPKRQIMANVRFIAAAPRLIRQLLAALSSPTPRSGETP